MKLLITGGSGFIGTNFVELLCSNNLLNFVNIDKQKPCNEQHDKYWVECDILDLNKFEKLFDDFNPTHVLHLAARTDTSSDKLEDYNDNTNGTANLIKIIEKSSSVEHVIITSTQYVYKNDICPYPKSDVDYKYHTIYGLSKQLTEDYIRNSSIKCKWTIIRPTNVWGPWNMRYPNELWKILDLGFYFHPRKADPIKSFAYVKNVVHQILKIYQSPSEVVSQQVFYVGDLPISSTIWINSFSEELTGKSIRYFPRWFMYSIALFGSGLNAIGYKFPLNLVRYNNMIDDYTTPMEKTINTLGLSHPNLESNVKETVGWFKNEGKNFFKYWQSK
jgi:nucleoside-diphosphate-sugar epimerase